MLIESKRQVFFTPAQSDTIFNWLWLAIDADCGDELVPTYTAAHEIVEKAGSETLVCLETLASLFDCDTISIAWEALRRL